MLDQPKKRNRGAVAAPGGRGHPSEWSLRKAVTINLCGLLFAGAIVFVGGWLLLGRPARPGPRELDSARWFEAVKVGLAVVAGLGAAVGLTVSYRRQRVEEGRQRVEEERHRAERIKEFGDRYTKAGELLGHEKAAVRLAGVVAFARLADDWVEQQQTCIDVLCSYLRMPSDPVDSGEREVRLTVIRAVRDHLVRDAPVSWQGRDFDFTSATFDGGSFRGATFSGGEVSFDGATFSGGKVNFYDATFAGGRVSFSGATFSDGAEVSFNCATFSDGAVSFYRATFEGGKVSFGFAEFKGGEVSFDSATFAGGEVVFALATFSGGTVGFDNATFAGGKVDYAATFSGGTVSFAFAKFKGGEVSFFGATFAGGRVLLDRVTSWDVGPRYLPEAAAGLVLPTPPRPRIRGPRRDIGWG